jgi:hypothetical protein
MRDKAVRVQIERFTVVGRGEFPYDMLRYDSCCPDRSEDASAMRDGVGQRQVQLRRYAVNSGGPTVERWQSFGWSVVKNDYGQIVGLEDQAS